MSNGITMIGISIFLSAIMLFVVSSYTNNFTSPKWAIFIPTIICIIIMIIGFVMMLIGPGGSDQLFYLGVFMYSLSMFVFTGIGEIIITIARRNIGK